MNPRRVIPLVLCGTVILGLIVDVNAVRHRRTFDTTPAQSFSMGEMLHTTVAKSEDGKLKQAFRNSLKDIEGRYPLIPVSFFEKSYETYGPELMIDVLDEDPLCHVQAHNLGRVIYAHTNNLVSSLAVCQNKCNEGCLHGVLMGMFNTPVNEGDPSVASFTPAVQQEVASTCSNPDVLKYTGVGNCYHAIGHVITSLVNNDASRAVPLCESVFKASGPGAAFYCATGVYMQQDITATVDGSGTVDLACQKSSYPAACYRFQLYHQFHLPSEYKQAAAFCLSLSGLQRSGCFNGLGADAYAMVYRDPSSLNQLCGAGDDLDKRLCVEGVFALLNVYFPQAFSSVCSFYTVGDASVCAKASKLHNFSMEYDFTRYVP